MSRFLGFRVEGSGFRDSQLEKHDSQIAGPLLSEQEFRDHSFPAFRRQWGPLIKGLHLHRKLKPKPELLNQKWGGLGFRVSEG